MNEVSTLESYLPAQIDIHNLLKNSTLSFELSKHVLELNKNLIGSIAQMGIKNAIIHQINPQNSIKKIEDYTKGRYELAQLGLRPMSIGAMLKENEDVTVSQMTSILCQSCAVIGLDSSKINEMLVSNFLIPTIQEDPKLNSITLVEFKYCCVQMVLGRYSAKHYNNFNLEYIVSCLNEFAEQRIQLYYYETQRYHKRKINADVPLNYDKLVLERSEKLKDSKQVKKSK